jgi:hypothetical protein
MSTLLVMHTFDFLEEEGKFSPPYDNCIEAGCAFILLNHGHSFEGRPDITADPLQARYPQTPTDRVCTV